MPAFLEVSLVSSCVNVCSYCPQQLLKRNYLSPIKLLSLENFKTAINKLPPNSTISFAGFCEPFSNPECVDMILYANEKGHKIMVLSSLANLETQQYQRLRDVYFYHFSIHLPDSLGKSKININSQYIDTLKYIIANPPQGTFLFNHHAGEIHQSIKDLIPHSYLLDIHDRAGNVVCEDEIKEIYHEGHLKCGHAFMFNYKHGAGLLLPNGDIQLCCSDFGLKHKLGNILEDSWEEIIYSPEMEFLIEGLYNPKLNTLCRKCYLACPAD
jgi:hypothetical protein